MTSRCMGGEVGCTGSDAHSQTGRADAAAAALHLATEIAPQTSVVRDPASPVQGFYDIARLQLALPLQPCQPSARC